VGVDINFLKNSMDNRTKMIFAIFLLSVLLVTFFVYKKYFLDKNYPVYAEVPCDPVVDVCFVYRCDSETEECTGVVEDDTSYYKKVERSAESFPLCDPNDEACAVTVCDHDDIDCAVTFCDPADTEVECSSPSDFQTIEEEPESQESVVIEDESQVLPILSEESQSSRGE
jgi:hypothetical protein